MTDSDDINRDDISQILQQGASDGLFEVAEESDEPGSTRYKLTNFGNVEAERTIAEKGLPFLVMVNSRQAIQDGKARTVKSMADDIIKNFPGKLKREAKLNFAPFWNEYASMSPQEYLDAYTEVES